MNLLEELGLNTCNLVAGFAGGVVKLSNAEPMPYWKWLTVLISSTLTAGYVTPLLAKYVELPNKVEYSAAFIIGLAALQIINLIFRTFENTKPIGLIKLDKPDD